MRNKKIVLVVFVGFVLFAVSSASAQGFIPLSEKGRDKNRADNSSVIEETGEHLVLSPPGLEKILFVHYKKGFAKPPWAGKKPKKEAKCYAFLARGLKWKDDLPIDYVIDPTNSDLAEDFVASAISAGAEEWDTHTDAELFNDEYEIVHDGTWDSDTPDGRNEMVFGDYPDTNVIGVAVVWGYFSGPPGQRRIVEFDVLFDTDFAWGDATINSGVMDLENIATHEIGHGLGLADIYDSSCSEVTMYGYSEEGETKKRTLEQPDITGIRELYGI